METVHIHVAPLTDVLTEDDAAIGGVYQTRVPKGPPGTMAGQALDAFHDSYGIEELDNFDIRVFTGMPEGAVPTSIAALGTEIVQDEQYPEGEWSGEVEKIADSTPLESLSDKGSPHL